MTLSPRTRVFVLALAALAVLAACNPLTLRRNDAGSFVARYDGPSGGWLEVSVTGTQGFDVDYRLLLQEDDEASNRSCRDAATGAVEPCEVWGIIRLSDLYRVTSTAFRSALSPLDDDVPLVLTWCYQGGEPVDCPTVQVTVRVVDAQGRIVGDLTDQTVG